MIRVFDFECNVGHLEEVFCDDKTTQIECPICGSVANRLVSKPNFKLDGITGSFPTAADKWANNHEQAARVANKKYLEHGSL